MVENPQKDGNEAIRLSSSNPYDVIMLNVLLPIKNRFEVYSELRANGLCLRPYAHGS